MMRAGIKSLLIVHRAQFGYHTDVYKWCEFLRNDYRVSTVTFHDGKPGVNLSGVKNHYVRIPLKSRTLRGICFVLCAFARILFFKGKVIVCFFPGCHFLGRVFRKRHIAVDFRTMSVKPDDSARYSENLKMILAARSFPSVISISDGVAGKLTIDPSKVHILPLGADVVSTNNKLFDSLHLLYVGTFDYRHLDKTIVGIRKVMDQSAEPITISYDIVGDGRHGELDEYRRLVSLLGLDGIVRLHGYVQHNELGAFYDKCNVGVSFVPLTEWYEFQPVTKTFEYALSGLYTIATATYENKKVINEANGILIDDTPEAFAEAVFKIIDIGSGIQSDSIRASMSGYTWASIVNGKMKPILEKI